MKRRGFLGAVLAAAFAPIAVAKALASSPKRHVFDVDSVRIAVAGKPIVGIGDVIEYRYSMADIEAFRALRGHPGGGETAATSFVRDQLAWIEDDLARKAWG